MDNFSVLLNVFFQNVFDVLNIASGIYYVEYKIYFIACKQMDGYLKNVITLAVKALKDCLKNRNH
jgi:hypothetical protein